MRKNCKECGKAFEAGRKAQFCSACRRLRLSESAKRNNLNKAGNDSYAEQQKRKRISTKEKAEKQTEKEPVVKKQIIKKERKKNLDNLAADMIQCKKDGFGCHYGKWKALQPFIRFKRELPIELDDGKRVCKTCGAEFYYYGKGIKQFCSSSCYQVDYYQRVKLRRMAENG